MLIGGQVALAQASAHGLISRDYVDSDQESHHRYVVFVPQGDPPDAGWPLVLFLHGAGERGADGQRQTMVGLGPLIKRRVETFPAIVVFPQADYAEGPILETWRSGEPGGQLARRILAEVERDYLVNPRRRSVTGWSMGGYGALALAAADPEHWSKVLALAGGGEQEWAPALATLPVWLVHGTDDAIVPVSESQAVMAALEQHEHQARLSEVAETGHGLWRWVYNNDAVLDWLIAPPTEDPPASDLSLPDDIEQTPRAADDETPFVPALVISRAISLRLGNDALQTLLEGLPEMLGEKGLSGTLTRVEDQVEFDDREFDVRFDGLTYQGRLHRAILRGRDADRMQLSFAVRDFEVTLDRIEVSDSRDGVIAGPVAVIIGHREPVWLDFDVHPSPSPTGGLQLDLLQAKFKIPDHNWYVKPPEQIAIQGDLFSPDIVETAIVGGVYIRKAIIEEQILSAAPDILEAVERQIDFSPLSSLITALWPLPVYSPRVRILLEETSTDPQGASLVFGCVIAGLEGDATTSQEVPHVTASAPAASGLAKIPDLQAGVSLEVIGHLTSLVAGSDAARLYAADVPGRPFQELDNVANVLTAAGAAGSESSVNDVRSQFLLLEPFSLRPITTASEVTSNRVLQNVRIAIDVPRLSVKVAQNPIRYPDRDRQALSAPAQWSPLEESDVSIRQPIQLTTVPDSDGPTTLHIRWGADAVVTDLSEAAGDSPLQTSGPPKIAELFQQGWARWAASVGETQIAVPDVAVGPATLRLSGLLWKGTQLTAAFRPAPITLVNDTDRSVQYRIRGPNSRWSSEFGIEPHTRHLYATGYPLHIRLSDSASLRGQALSLGTYEWSPTADASGFHWVRRVLPTNAQSTATATSPDAR